MRAVAAVPPASERAPTAPRIAGTTDQRAPLPRHLAPRRAAAPGPRLQRRAARRAPAAHLAGRLRQGGCRCARRATSPTAIRAASPGPRARPARPAGSRSSFVHTATRSSASPSPRRYPGTAGSGGSTCSRESPASPRRRSSSWPTATTTAPGRERTATVRAPPRCSSSRAPMRLRGAQRGSRFRTRCSSSRPTPRSTAASARPDSRRGPEARTSWRW